MYIIYVLYIFSCFPAQSSNWYLGQLSWSKDLNMIYFKKHYFLTLASNTKLVLNAVAIAAEQNVWRDFNFLLKADLFCSFNTFLKKEKQKGKFSYNLRQKIFRIFHDLAEFLFTTSEIELDFISRKWRCDSLTSFRRT